VNNGNKDLTSQILESRIRSLAAWRNHVKSICRTVIHRVKELDDMFNQGKEGREVEVNGDGGIENS